MKVNLQLKSGVVLLAAVFVDVRILLRPQSLKLLDDWGRGGHYLVIVD